MFNGFLKMMGDRGDNSSDIIIEVIELFINSILYIREIYPEQIFEKKKYFNTPVYASIYPPLNDYVEKVLKTIQELKATNELQQVEVVIYKDDYETYENYVFDIDDKNPILYENNDLYLIQFEEEIRKALYMLSNRLKDLEKLPKDVKFKVNLHTTQSAFVKMSNNSMYQDFPWLQQTGNSLPNKSRISILPLTSVERVGLQIYAERF